MLVTPGPHGACLTGALATAHVPFQCWESSPYPQRASAIDALGLGLSHRRHHHHNNTCHSAPGSHLAFVLWSPCVCSRLLFFNEVPLPLILF